MRFRKVARFRPPLSNFTAFRLRTPASHRAAATTAAQFDLVSATSPGSSRGVVGSASLYNTVRKASPVLPTSANNGPSPAGTPRHRVHVLAWLRQCPCSSTLLVSSPTAVPVWFCQAGDLVLSRDPTTPFRPTRFHRLDDTHSVGAKMRPDNRGPLPRRPVHLALALLVM